jgi:hypothetical protein
MNHTKQQLTTISQMMYGPQSKVCAKLVAAIRRDSGHPTLNETLFCALQHPSNVGGDTFRIE